MATRAARLLVLGIDAANPVLLERWAADGTLPNLRALIARGLVGETRSLEGFFIGATWPSLYTGVTPARHGLHYLVQLKPGTYEFQRMASDRITRREPFWEPLSRAGRRVAVLDVPLTQIRCPLNGVQIVEWSAHDALCGFDTWPRELAGEIRSRFGMPPLGPSCDGSDRSADDYQRLVDVLIQGVQLKADLTLDLLRQGGWDLFMQVFTETHCAGHQCWHLHDVDHPAHDRGVVARTGDPLRRVYIAVDRAIGAILEQANPQHVFVIAAHGMSHWYGAQFLLDEILERLGVSQPAAPAREPSPMRAAARSIWRRLPDPVRQGLNGLRDLASREEAGGLPALRVDPLRSACFAVNNGQAVGSIRLNLAGREPQGMLRPGSDAESFCEQLEAALLAIIDERSGAPLVARVLRTRDLYHGPFLDHLPDLLVEWNDALPTGSLQLAGGVAASVGARSPRIGRIAAANSYGRSGEHRPGGIFIAAGPGLRPARLERTTSILDFAPTFARILGVDLPDGDGRILEEL